MPQVLDHRAQIGHAHAFGPADVDAAQERNPTVAHDAGRVAQAPGGDKRIMTLRQPVGVSVMVTPWNFPAAMATRKLGPALAAGCTAILAGEADVVVSGGTDSALGETMILAWDQLKVVSPDT